MTAPGTELARLDERLNLLSARYGFSRIDSTSFADFIAQPRESLVLFADDPAKVPETWDMMIILPEIVAALKGNTPRVGLLSPADARGLAPRYGITLWPALLAARDGAFLGAIEGLKDWSVYARRVPELLLGEPKRPPGIGIPVRNADAQACH